MQFSKFELAAIKLGFEFIWKIPPHLLDEITRWNNKKREEEKEDGLIEFKSERKFNSELKIVLKSISEKVSEKYPNVEDVLPMKEFHDQWQITFDEFIIKGFLTMQSLPPEEKKKVVKEVSKYWEKSEMTTNINTFLDEIENGQI